MTIPVCDYALFTDIQYIQESPAHMHQGEGTRGSLLHLTVWLRKVTVPLTLYTSLQAMAHKKVLCTLGCLVCPIATESCPHYLVWIMYYLPSLSSLKCLSQTMLFITDHEATTAFERKKIKSQ